MRVQRSLFISSNRFENARRNRLEHEGAGEMRSARKIARGWKISLLVARWSEKFPVHWKKKKTRRIRTTAIYLPGDPTSVRRICRILNHSISTACHMLRGYGIDSAAIPSNARDPSALSSLPQRNDIAFDPSPPPPLLAPDIAKRFRNGPASHFKRL